jgi:hypothetical protein
MSASQSVTLAEVEYDNENKAVSVGLFNNDDTRTLLPGPRTNATYQRISEISFTADGSIMRQFGTGTAWVLTPNDLTIIPAPKEERPLQLSLVLQNQPPEPKHWSLFVARQGERGYVYQAIGAPDVPNMTYWHVPHIDIIKTRAFATSCVMASPLSESDAWLVHNYAHSEAPPCAKNGEPRDENCQGWACRVLEKLVAHGVVSQPTLDYARTLMEPFQWPAQQELKWNQEKVQQGVFTVSEQPGVV